jgi:hypothetical protein
MAYHPRKLIRDAVAAQLADKTVAQERVVKSKKTPWTSRQLPGIAVYTLDEETDAEASRPTCPRDLRRQLTVSIESALVLRDDIDDALDAFALEIENAIDADPTFGVAGVADAMLVSTAIRIDPQAEQPVGIATLTYLVTYYTRAVPAAT